MVLDYINKNPKPISKEQLKKILYELDLKHQKERREQFEAVTKALSDGFRCGPKF